MAVSNHDAVIKKLQNQVRLLKRKEAQAKVKLQQALKHATQLSKKYEDRLNGAVRVLKGKMAESHAAGYFKAAAQLERQLLNNIEKKAKAVTAAVMMIEKKFAVNLAKSKSSKVGSKRKAKKSPAKGRKKL